MTHRFSFHQRLFFIIAAIIWISLQASMARAQDVNRAKVRFDDGMREMPEGNYEKACPAFAESLRLDPLPGTAFTLAVCESRWGRVATARARFDDFLRMVAALPNKEQKKQSDRVVVAKEQIAKLEAVIPTLILRLPPDSPRTMVVKRNDMVVEPTEIGTPIALDPGDYELSTEVPGLPLRKKRIFLVKGEKKTITLEVPLPASQLLTETNHGSSSGRKTAGFVIGGVGLAAIVTGVVATAIAIDQRSKIDAHCGAKIGETDPKKCDQIGFDAAQNIQSSTIISTIGFVAGGVGLGLGIILVATSPKKDALDARTSRPRIEVGLGGSSRHVGFDIRGAW